MGQPVSITIELQVHSLAEEDVRAVEDVLQDPRHGVSVRRWPRARVVDPLTVFAVIGGIVGLVDALQSLQERWITRRRAVKVLLRNEDGDEIELTTANRASLESFMERSGSIDVIQPPD